MILGERLGDHVGRQVMEGAMTASERIRSALKQPLVVIGLLVLAVMFASAVRRGTVPPMVQFAIQDFDAEWNNLGECLDSSSDLCSCVSEARAVIRSGDRLVDVAREEKFEIDTGPVVSMSGLAENTVAACR